MHVRIARAGAVPRTSSLLAQTYSATLAQAAECQGSCKLRNLARESVRDVLQSRGPVTAGAFRAEEMSICSSAETRSSRGLPQIASKCCWSVSGRVKRCLSSPLPADDQLEDCLSRSASCCKRVYTDACCYRAAELACSCCHEHMYVVGHQLSVALAAKEASHLLANSRFNEAAAAKLTECCVDT